MNVVLLIARLLLAAIFGVAGIAKLADPAGSRRSMSDFGVPKSLSYILGLLFPLAELSCALALIPLASAWWGATGILALLLLFIAGISVSLIRGRRPDCHCFGQLQSSPIGWNLVLRNIVLAAIAAIVVYQGPQNAGASVIHWRDSLPASQSPLFLFSCAIAGLAAFQFWALVHMLRQNGRLLLRIEALEARPSEPVEETAPGLPVNSLAPAFSLQNLDGQAVTLDSLSKHAKPLLLFFSETDCGACDAALPDLSQWQREYADHVLIVPIIRGEAKDNRTKVQQFKLENVLLQANREAASAYLVDQVPTAVLVTEGRIASPLAVGADAIRSLVARAVLPPSVNHGDPVPSLRFPDLTGAMLDLATLSRRTLILFWNPSCGYCQQMLDDLKVWERARPADAPELLVIAAGSLESNRRQAFRSTVLLDPYFAASQVFNSGGTPSAIIVDHGRVASQVGVGAQSVLAMAGAVPASIGQAG